MMQIRQDKNYFICQYFAGFPAQIYDGLYETFTGNCPNPSGSEQRTVSFQPDQSDPHLGFLTISNSPNGAPITVDEQGFFQAHFDIPDPSPFGNECNAQPQTLDISGQITLQSITFTIDQGFINLTDNPNDQVTCQLLGQTCHVPSEFNGTAQ